MPFMRECKKKGRAKSATDGNVMRRRKDARIEARTHRIKHVMLFRDINSCTNAPECCVIRALPVLFIVTFLFAIFRFYSVAYIICIACGLPHAR